VSRELKFPCPYRRSARRDIKSRGHQDVCDVYNAALARRAKAAAATSDPLHDSGTCVRRRTD
jgi:hypothetical protein